MSRSVLVVDDEPGMRETLVDILTSAGYIVTPAEDGAAALEKARAQPYDVIIMDIRMPAMTGVEVLASLEHPPPQVVLMTGYAVDEQLRSARENNAFAIMQKPFQVSYLLRIVAEAVRGAA
ncbi:MAG TPA: response regulator [Mycobacteriales bacterium]|jgi:CheY-like chemotaxis protein|nr:response regulator [Mycobacteriales bacterium]